jgi:hypothetical protein
MLRFFRANGNCFFPLAGSANAQPRALVQRVNQPMIHLGVTPRLPEHRHFSQLKTLSSFHRTQSGGRNPGVAPFGSPQFE